MTAMRYTIQGAEIKCETSSRIFCNVTPGGNKGIEGRKSSFYLLGINQIIRMINKCEFLLQYFKGSDNILPPSSLLQIQRPKIR